MPREHFFYFLLDELSVVSPRMSSHSWAKNSSWCTGWESQQQRRKPRPGSQISSVSADVLIWLGALAGAMFSSLSGRASAICSLPWAPSPTVHLRVSRVLTRLLCVWHREEDVLLNSKPAWMIIAVLQCWNSLCWVWECLHHPAWVLLFSRVPSNYYTY